MKRLVIVAGAAAAASLLWAAPASADITNPPGRCVGTASFRTGTEDGGPFAVSTADLQPGDVLAVPLKDVVDWTGTVVGVEPGTEREVSGSITLTLPWPLPEVTIDSWSGTATDVGNAGVEEYELPSVTPRGVELELSGVHREAGAVWCTGAINVEVDGSPWSSPLTFVSVGGLAFSGVALALAGRPKYPVMTA